MYRCFCSFCWVVMLLIGGCATPADWLAPFPDESQIVATAVPCQTPAWPLPSDGALLPNPVLVPVVNRDTAWEAIVDVVDDYFRIAREERVQLVGNLLTEGQIETFPQMGATLLEPHRHDSVGPSNRLLATYQTIRRVALIRVVPAEGGYQIEAIVEAQMEDLPHPEHATAGAATLRTDTSVRPERDTALPRSSSGVWYPIGRDIALEQQILGRIRSCLDVAPPGVVY